MNIKIITFILFAGITAFAQQTYPTIGKTESYDVAFNELVAADSKVEVIATGLQWAEGPVWYKNGHCLLFSDPKQNTVFKWDEKSCLQVFLYPSGYTGLGSYSDEPGSNGLLITPNGELVSCEHGDRRISSMSLVQGGKVTLADHWQGKRFNSPNDICRHSNGTYFFTDPPYGLPLRGNDTINREIYESGVYRLGTDGVVTMFESGLQRPNGIVLSPDESVLYVSQSDGSGPYIMQYVVKKDGTIGNGSIFFDFSKAANQDIKRAAADGMRIDADGNIYAAAANGIVVLSPKGKILGRIITGVPTSNCAFSPDGYLYITANHYLCRVKVKSNLK